MVKFKVGDRVRVLDKVSILEHQRKYINKTYTISKISSANAAYCLDLDDNFRFYENELELATIPDSKLARRLYKNMIKEIKDGKIWLK